MKTKELNIDDDIMDMAYEYREEHNESAAAFAREIDEDERMIQKYFAEYRLPKKRCHEIEMKIVKLIDPVLAHQMDEEYKRALRYAEEMEKESQIEMPIEDDHEFHVIAIKEPEKQNITVGLTSSAMELVKKVSDVSGKTQKEIVSEMVIYACDHIKYDRR